MAHDRGGRSFEWDENKRLGNIAKHGIDFEDAKEAFSDPAAFTYASARSAAEHRDVTVGRVNGTLIAVISTRRAGVIRIISARVARREERAMYD